MTQKKPRRNLKKVKVVRAGAFACLSVFVVVMFPLTGIWFIYLGNAELQLSRASYNWPHVIGQVVGAEIAYQSNTDSPDVYTPIVTYEYVVNDRRYQSQQVSISGGTYHTESGAVQVINQYPVNSQVTVYYDPDQPDYSVLELEVSGYGVLVAGVIFTGLSIAGIFYANWSRRHSSTKARRENDSA